jgi:hypothetical protein
MKNDALRDSSESHRVHLYKVETRCPPLLKACPSILAQNCRCGLVRSSASQVIASLHFQSRSRHNIWSNLINIAELSFQLFELTIACGRREVRFAGYYARTSEICRTSLPSNGDGWRSDL